MCFTSCQHCGSLWEAVIGGVVFFHCWDYSLSFFFPATESCFIYSQSSYTISWNAEEWHPQQNQFHPTLCPNCSGKKLKTCSVVVRGATELGFTGQQLLYKVVDHRKAGRRCSGRLVDFQGKANPSGALRSLCATFRLLSIKATKQKIP